MHYAKEATQLRDDLAETRLIRPGEAAAIRGVTVSTIYRACREGRLPAPRRISHRVSGWPAREILPLLIAERPAA